MKTEQLKIEIMADVQYYGDYRLIRDCIGNWYCESFKETFNTLAKIKRFIDGRK